MPSHKPCRAQTSWPPRGPFPPPPPDHLPQKIKRAEQRGAPAVPPRPVDPPGGPGLVLGQAHVVLDPVGDGLSARVQGPVELGNV